MIRSNTIDPKSILAYINEYFRYSDDQLGFVYKKATKLGWERYLGQRIGNINPRTGYVSVKIRGKLYREHQLVFLLFNERWPEKELDHVNSVLTDNRISNLRECDRSKNCANRRRWGKTTNYRGVQKTKRGRPYCAVISVHGKKKHLGTFDTQEAAAMAFDRAAKQVHGEFATLNFPEIQCD